MYKPMTLLAMLMAGFLTACGGSDGGSVVQGGNNTDNGTDGGTTDVDNGDGTTDGVTTGTNIQNPRLGVGTGDSFQEGQLTVSATSLSAGGTSQISAFIVDSDNGNAKIISKSYGVKFSSICSSAVPAKASFSKAEVVAGGGEVSVTYEAQGCSGTDIVTFTLYDADGANIGDTVLHTATGTLTVQPPEAGQISFNSVSAARISIDGIANPVLPKTSVVTFTVLDETENPIEGKTVNFVLTNDKGGARLTVDSAVSDEAGQVKAIVQAGSAHTTTSVRATTLSNDGLSPIQSTSQQISVTTGIADQDSFEIAAEKYNPPAGDRSGEVVKITAYVGDQFNNPVAQGTTINFTTESGLIVGACQTDETGSCEVEWESSGYRPGQEDDGDFDGLNRVNEKDPRRSNASVYGLTTILAYTEGTAGFTDSNNNGVYDVGEPFESFAEAIRDDDVFNRDPRLSTLAGAIPDPIDYDEGIEFNADYDGDGVRDGAPSVYQGALCSDEAKAQGHCASLMNIRDSIVISQSDSDEVLLFLYSRTDDTFTPIETTNFLDSTSGGSFYVYLTDIRYSMPSSGTALAVNGDGFEVSGESGEVDNSIGLQPASFTGLASSFGQLYFVAYTPDGNTKQIELAVGEDKVVLTPAP